MARTPKAKKTITEAGVDFTFSHGEEVSVALKDMPKAIVNHLAIHGLSQKLGDSYASSEGAETAFALFNAVLERLKNGEWAKAREGGGSSPRSTILAEALARATGKDIGEAASVVTGMDDAQKKALQGHPGIVAATAAIKAERAQEKATKAAEAAGDAPDLATLL